MNLPVPVDRANPAADPNPTDAGVAAPRAPSAGERALMLGAFLVCAAVLVATVGDASYALHNDGPQHRFAAEVHHRHDEPALGWQSIYQATWPTTARGALELHLLARTLGASSGLAHTVVIDVALVLWMAAFFALVVRLCPQRWPMALLGLATAFQLSYGLGTLPFLLGTSCALLVLAREVGAQRSSLGRDALLCGALLAIAAMHVMAAAMAGLFVVAVRAAGPRPVRDVGAAIVAGLPALVLDLAVVGELNAELSSASAPGAPLDAAVALVRDFVLGEPWRGGCVLALAGVSALLLIREHWRRGRRELALGAVALLFLGGTLFAPEDLGEWQLFRPRLLPLAFAALLALLPVERLPQRARLLLAGALFAFGVSSALAARAANERLELIFRPVIDGMRLAPPQPRTWAAVVTVVDEPVAPSRTTPWLHVAQLAALELGGRPAYAQDERPAAHGIVARNPSTSLISPPFPGMWPKAWAADLDGDRHAAVVRAFAAWGLAVDGLVVYGRADDRAALWAGGQDVSFVRELAFDRVVYATDSVGCVVDVEVRGPAEPLAVRIGFVPSEGPLEVALVGGADGVARFTRAPCGDVWIETDAAPCAGADARGRLRVEVDRRLQPVVVRCERAFTTPSRE